MTFEQAILLISGTVNIVIAIMTYLNRKAIQEVHLLINSRLTALLEATKGVSLAEGREIGCNENK